MPTISFQDAIGMAKATLPQLYADDLPREVALEEIELVTEEKRELWAVTLGYFKKRSVSTTANSSLAFFSPQSLQVENRVYKTLLIDAETGLFVRMDMRLVK
jgi:hypothetical protein